VAGRGSFPLRYRRAVPTAPADITPRHILVLTDRDWAHPQGGGTGTNLYGQVARWIAWGHRVTVIAGSYPGAPEVERPHELLEIHRTGTRLTVFPRAARLTRRGVGRDADVCLEVVNGIAFFTPLWRWLRMPRVTLVHHVHADHYVTELGRRGRVAAVLLERLPLRFLYRPTPFLTISRAAQQDLVDLGVPAEQVHVAYLGVDAPDDPPSVDADEPTLLYLGRLKAYKRIEHVLDALEAVPGARLDLAGEGDHREALEAEIARRGLGERVTLHGHVSEERKWELLGRAWVNLTASSAEGWCLTVMEAGSCGTPSAAMRVGGLPESIVDEQTGVLADTPQELAEKVAGLMADPVRRRRLGDAARTRAHGFTWDATAAANLAVLDQAAAGERPRLRDTIARSQTGAAAGLAGATLANNAIQLLFTIAITRLLGADGYGALAAIIGVFLILLVGGQSLQAAAARETALGALGDRATLRATLRSWTLKLLLATVAMGVLGVLLRDPLAAATGTPEHPWAAAAIPATGALWMLVSLQRGVLQGLHAFGPVARSLVLEAVGRLVAGVLLVAVGAGVTGAFLGTPLTILLTIAVLWVAIDRRLAQGDPEAAPPVPAVAAIRSLGDLVSGGWVPILGLLLLAVLQNIDVVIARHELDADRAGAYAIAAVAAKSVVWVAIGVGLQLLPEATRRHAAGLDPRPVLARALGVLVVVAAPALLIFALVPELLLELAFGPEGAEGADALLLLGVAMTLLAVAYLTVQYMLALRATRFLWVLGAVAIAEVLVLFNGDFGIVAFATIVLGVQVVAAGAVLALGLRIVPRGGPRTPAVT
jgi:glycosyltransferase involved in cell wall biosynthesis/O-antigen/teichoic acid export membrane protein